MGDNIYRQRHGRHGVLFLLLGLLLAFSGCGTVNLQEIARKYDAMEQKARISARVTWWGVAPPLGYFLLVRKGPTVCALRFTEFHRGEARQPTIFYSAEPNLSASYEWYAPEEESSDFSKPTVRVGRGEASSKAAVGIFRVRFPRGSPYVDCDSLVLLWDYPNDVGFFPNRYGREIELAPTKWREISEVNPHDPRLTWYRSDETRKAVTRIPIDKLW